MSRRQSTTLQLAASLLCALAIGAVAQQPAAPPPLPLTQPPQTAPDSSTPTLKVKTQLTLEDVTVTDAKDKPVHGLTESDFSVKEDGKPQAIKNFQEYTAQPPQAPPRLPPNVYTNRQTTVPSAYNILLFDDVATGMGLGRPSENLMRSKQAAIKYLKTITPGTQVAVLVLAAGVRIVQGFTSDRDLLLAAIKSIQSESVPGTYMLPRPPPMPHEPPDLSIAVEACMVMNAQDRVTTDALDEVANFVSGIKGRKNLIWFTPGIPWLTDPAFFNNACVADPTPQLHKAYALLTAARVAIDPIDPAGLVPRSRLALNGSIQDIAESTGGKAYFNRNDLDAAVGEAIATGTDYYSLSYVPPLSKSDGKHHSINVQVDRPHVHLQYREGYVASDYAPPKPSRSDNKNLPNPQAPDSAFNAAMGYGLPDAAELPFTVTVQPSTQPSQPDGSSSSTALGSPSPGLKGAPLVRYDFLYDLPGSEIALASDDAAGIQKGSLQLLIAAYSTDGELLNTLGQTATYTIKPDEVEQFKQQPERIPVQLDLPPGKVVVRVGVLDVSSQRMGITEIPETVVQPSPARAASTATVRQQSPPRRASQAKTAKILSVAQMEQLLASSQGNADGQVAQQLAGVELSERVGLARMARWEKDFSGNKTREQLMRLADSAAFFNPPAEDVVLEPMPDATARTKIFAQAIDFAKTTFSRLPNFYATRYTTHFDNETDAGQATWQNSLNETRPMRVIGTYSMTVAFRQGSEVHEKAGKGARPEPSRTGLTTNGEFGPILGIVLGDAISSRSVTWSRWEQGERGPIAVFRYLVPQDHSSYTTQIPDGLKLIELHPGYHGEIAIDPATGSILRISVVTDMAPPHQAIAMAMLIEYAPVTMGGRTYICPVHGVAYSKIPLTTPGPVQVAASRPAAQNAVETMRTELNDTVFTQYHRFGSEMRIVVDSTSQTDGNSP